MRYYHVLVGRVVGRFPLDDGKRLPGEHRVEVPGGQPVVRDHLHHDVVRRWPLVGRHHTDQEQVLLVPLHDHGDVVGGRGGVVRAPVQFEEGCGVEDAVDLQRRR